MSLFISLVLLAAVPRVGAELDFIGFSADGRYLAFEQYGHVSGADTEWSDIYFIDVPNNKSASQPVELIGEEGESEESVRRKARNKAQEQLTALGIVEGNRGQHLLSHLFTDIGVDPHTAQFSRCPPIAGYDHCDRYALVLTEIDSGKTFHDLGRCHMMSLTVQRQGDSAPIILQEDSVLPENRGCPYSYRIQDVYLRGGYIVVFLNMSVPGFEGGDMRFLAVTGKIKN